MNFYIYLSEGLVDLYFLWSWLLQNTFKMHLDKWIWKWGVQRTSGFEIFCHTLQITNQILYFCQPWFYCIDVMMVFCSTEVNYEELARCTDDFNGAMCKAVCVEAVSTFHITVFWYACLNSSLQKCHYQGVWNHWILVFSHRGYQGSKLTWKGH